MPRVSEAALIERRIFPSITDSTISNGSPSVRHFVYLDDSVPRPGKLFVFFPGTGGPPSGYKLILQTAAQIGYHAVGLAYMNDVAVNDVCSDQPATCAGNVRLEIIDGTDRSPLINVNRANSIENRLIKLLQHLHQNHPTEGWSNFLDAGQLRWDAMAFAGHSQGGGHAAMIGQIHTVHRVAMFSSTEPALWTMNPLLTPPQKFFGFAHTLEDGLQGMTRSWTNFGVPGILTNVDGAVPPFDQSHKLVTSMTPQGGINYHGCVVTDIYTPLQADGATPVFRNIWIYMIGPSGSGPNPLTVNLSRSGNNLILNWPSMPGEQFDLEQRPGFGLAIPWTPVTSNLFASSFSLIQVVSNALSAPAGFFQVRRK